MIHNILIEKLVLHNIVENRPVQHVTTGNNRFDYEELTIVIIEIKGVVTISDLKTENNKRI